MAITRWDPLREMSALRHSMDRLMEDSAFNPARFWREFTEGSVAMDVYQTANEVVVKVSLPGMKPEDVNITLTGDTLTISGESKVEEEVKRENYLLQEHRYGSFSRTITLPGGLKTDKAEAVFENGVLTLTIPRTEEHKPKTIKIKAQKTLKGKEAEGEKD